MRVVHFCNVFSSLSQTFIYDVITELEQQQVDNVVFANKLENQQDRPFSNVVTVPLAPVSFVEKKWNRLMVKAGLQRTDSLKWKQRRKALHGLLKKYKPDVVHAHFGPQGCMALPPASDLKIPLVVSFHGFDAFKLPNEVFWMQQYKTLFKDAAAITVVSQLMKEHLVKLGCDSKKIHIIHVGKRIPEYLFKERINVPIKTFLSIGRMEEKKGHLDAIQVFKTLAAKHTELKLKIIGGGSLLQQAKDLVAQLNLQNVVELTGEMPHAGVKEQLYAADAFILCSKTAADGDREGVPTVLMEAQAIGLPCVSTRHSGIPEVIPVENQWMLAAEGNVHELANIVERLITTPAPQLEAIRSLGRHKVEQEFNLAKETEKLQHLYKAITGS